MPTIVCPCCGHKEQTAAASAGRIVLCANCGSPCRVGDPASAFPESRDEIGKTVLGQSLPDESSPESCPVPPGKTLFSRELSEVSEDSLPIATPLDSTPVDGKHGIVYFFVAMGSGFLLFLLIGTGLYLTVPLLKHKLASSPSQAIPGETHAPISATAADDMANLVREAPPFWIDASQFGLRHKDVYVQVLSVALEFVRGSDPRPFSSDGKYLVIHLQIENRSPTKTLTYRGWGATAALEGGAIPQLRDDRGVSYARATFGQAVRIDGQIDKVAVAPGESIQDLLVYQPPVVGVRFLRLELPATHLASQGKLCFEIRRTMIVESDASSPLPARPPAREPSVPEWCRKLQDADPQVRIQAAQALGDRGAEAAAAVSHLKKALEDREVSVVCAAVQALGKIGPTAHEALPDLFRALSSSHESVQTAAAAALERLQPLPPTAVAFLRQALQDPQPRVRRYAIQSLGKVRVDKETLIPILVTALKNSDQEVRQQAIASLARLEPQCPQTILPALLDALQDQEESVRNTAAASLESLRPMTVADVPALRGALVGRDKAARLFAARVLADPGPAARSVVPDILRVYRDADEDLRHVLIAALDKLGDQGPDVVMALCHALTSKNRETRQQAITLLGTFGANARPAFDGITKAVCDEDAGVRKAAVVALTNLTPEALIPAYVRALKDSKEAVRREAAEAFVLMGPQGKAAKTDLNVALGEKVPAIRVKVARALCLITPQSRAPLPFLIQLLKDKVVQVRREAAECLGLIAPVAGEAVPMLSAALLDQDVALQRQAIITLGKMSATADAALPNLILCLRDPRLHDSAIDTLYKIGAKSIPLLIDVLESDDKSVRLAATIVLGKFGPAAKEAVRTLNAQYYQEKDPDLRSTIKDSLNKIRNRTP